MTNININEVIKEPYLIARSRLLAFCKLFYPQYDVDADHLVELSKYLEKVENGQIKRLIITMPPRHGKLIAHSVPILTTLGWKTHGELQEGDYVFHPSGKPVKVMRCSTENIATLEVKVTGGETIKVHPDHEWMVWTRSQRNWRVMETKDFTRIKLTTGPIGKRGGRYQFQLPNIEALQFEAQELPIPPYLLGLWLGDGTASKGWINHHKDDYAMIDKACVEPLHIHKTYIHKTTGVVSSVFSNHLYFAIKKHNLFKNKHIPSVYFSSSIEQRLELLAGLIDTDGNVGKDSRVRIVTGDPKLAKDIERLVHELGMRPYVMTAQPCVSSSGIVGKKVIYTIGFQPTMYIPTALERKKIKRLYKQRKLAITEVFPTLSPEKGKCIQVDSEDGLYLVGKSLVPTHNSMLTSELFPAWYLGRNPTKNVMFATYNHTFASEFGRKVRNTMIDPLFSQIFDGVTVSSDSQANDKFVTTHKGAYYALGIGGALTGRGANCVAQGTLIATDKGNIAIDHLLFNLPALAPINILSYNHTTNQLEYKILEGICGSGVSEIMNIRTCTGKTVTVTPDHPIYIMGKGYIKASELELDDVAITCNSTGHIEYAQISSISGIINQLPVYDIQVHENHNFLANGILVHNCLIIDDPIKNREEADSSLIRDKLKDWYTSTAYTRLEPNGAVIVIQTRWHYDDLAGYLLTQTNEHWTHLNLPAIKTDHFGKEHSLWPGKYSVEDLKHTQSVISSRDWAALYMQTPFTDEGRFFKIEKLAYYERPFTSNQLKTMHLYIFVDPANSKRKDSDNTAIVVMGFNTDRNYYLVDAYVDQFDLKEREDLIFELHEKYQPKCIYYEKYGMQIDIDYMRRAMEYRNYRFNIQELGGNKLTKEDRIKRLQPLMEDRKLFFPLFLHKTSTTGKEQELIAYLHEEMNSFPYGRHDDFLDALSRVCDIIPSIPNGTKINYYELYK